MSKEEKEFAIRNVHIDIIKRMAADIEGNADSYSFFQLDERQKKLQSDLHKFEAKNIAIACAEKGIDFDEAEFYDENERISRLCLDLKAKIRVKMNELEQDGKCANQAEIVQTKANISSSVPAGNDLTQPVSNENSNASIVQQNVQEMQSSAVEFTNFEGIFKWKNFETNVKEKLAENPELSNEQKYMALAAACTGTEAEQIVHHLGENNFEKAFEKLQWLSGSKYKQTQYAIHELLKIEQLNCQDGFETMSTVKRVGEIVNFLEHNDGKEFVKWVPFLLINRLNGDARLAWERQVKIQAKSWAHAGTDRLMYEYIPDWQDVRLFLEDEAELHMQRFTSVIESSFEGNALAGQPNIDKASQLCAKSNVNKQQIQKRTNNHCDCVERHPIHKCEEILAMNLSQRKAYMIYEKICMQCLWTSHPGSDCVDPLANRYCLRCAPTRIKHNSLLCPVSYEKAQQKKKLAIVTPMNSTPNWHAGNNNDGDW